MTTTIPLGFEVGTGKLVEIPVRHMVVAGQTQEAGKTTTMEALISRGNMPAVAFVTKRGEKSFTDAKRVQPYFREQADWQFVASVLEATMREKLKFERSWIIAASKGAHTLAGVQRNVRKMMESAAGLSLSVFTNLDAYLDIVVPRISKIKFASALEIRKGINVLDLSDDDSFPMELQSLVMRSCLEWVYRREEGTITIIPEAWEFIPQSRGSPVKLPALELMRKGAALRNFVWLDSQDIGGIDKEFVRQCPVWLLGKQREINEIKRTLDNIPAGVAKPRPGDIATLEIGQFFACWGKHVAKTYVWPLWMSSEEANAVAVGQTKAWAPTAKTEKPKVEREDTVTEKEANELRAENTRLRGYSTELGNSLIKQRERIEELENTLENLMNDTAPGPAPKSAADGSVDVDELVRVVVERVLKHPAIIELRAAAPEIRLRETREVVELDGKTLRGRLAGLVHEGWFDEPKVGNAAFNELKRRGVGTAKPNVYRELDGLAAMGFLTKETSGYHAVRDMKRNIVRAS